MSYKSPIEVVQTDMQTNIENEILTAVQRVGIQVDKEELIKALSYDLNQYEKGYKDRDNEIVRCKDCEYHYNEIRCICGGFTPAEWYCADGERRVK